MQDKKLYQTILGLDAPWKVADVELDENDGEIRVLVEQSRPGPTVNPDGT